MPPIDPASASTFMDLVKAAGPLAQLAAFLVIATMCLIAAHKYVFKDVLGTHNTVSENGKLAAQSMHAASTEHRAGTEAAKSTAAINLQMLEVLRECITEIREKRE